MLIPKKSLALALTLAALGAAYAQPMRPMVVVGGSMSPTYANGSVLWTQPVDRPLRRGDVVVVETPHGLIVKRVALLPGDHRGQCQTSDGWTDMTGFVMPHKRPRYVRFRTIPVPAGTVYLLGDNTGLSHDSRDFGPVYEERVVRLLVDQRDPDRNSGVERPTTRAWLALGTSRRARKG